VKRRVCIVTDAYLPGTGGIESHTLNLAAELQRLGHEVVVVTHQIPEHAPGLPRQVRSPVPVVRLPGVILEYRDHDIAVAPTMFLHFERLLRERRFDVIHGQSEGSMLVYGALALARLRGLPTVLTRHSVLSAKPRLAWPLVKWPVAALAGLANGVIAVSRACAEERLGFRGAVRVIPNGVDVGAFRPDPGLRARVRAELGYRDDEVIIGYVGRLHTSKGVPMLLRAFAGLGRPRARLLVAGPGPLRSMVARQAAGSAGAIRLLPALPFDGVARLLNALDIFAFPSEREAFGIALIESMACGLGSVAMGRLGVLDLAVDGVTGLLAQSDSEFRDALSRLATDREFRLHLGQNARQRAVERFSWPVVARATEDFYSDIIGR
jgi:glycosyltransferase involved in cell wall biosynthesis